MLGVALDGDDVDGLGLVGVNVDGKSEVGGKVAADFLPGVAGVVAAHHVPVLLHEEHAGTRGVHGDVVDAVADLGVVVGDVWGAQAAVDWPPSLPAVVGAKGSCGRDGDEHPLGIAGIENDGVQAHSSSARLPFGTRAMPAKTGELVPGLAAIRRAK